MIYFSKWRPKPIHPFDSRTKYSYFVFSIVGCRLSAFPKMFHNIDKIRKRIANLYVYQRENKLVKWGLLWTIIRFGCSLNCHLFSFIHSLRSIIVNIFHQILNFLWSSTNSLYSSRFQNENKLIEIKDRFQVPGNRSFDCGRMFSAEQ